MSDEEKQVFAADGEVMSAYEAEALAERVGLPSNDMKRLRADAEQLRRQQQRPEAKP